MNKKVGIGIGVAVLVLCVLCAAGAGIGGYLYQDKIMALLGLAPAQDIAAMLPEDTQMYLAVTPNIQNLSGYENLKKLYIDNPDIQAILDEFEEEVNEDADITYENDIKPWLGNEVVFAVTEFPANLNGPDLPTLVIAAKSSNKEASDKFIGKIVAEAKDNNEAFSETVYQDVTLYTESNSSSEPAIIATFNDTVLVSNSETLVKDMIDRTRESEMRSLVDSAQYQKVRSHLPAQAVFTAYMGFSELIEIMLQDSAIQLPPEQMKNLEAFEGMGTAATLQPNGLQMDVVVTYDVARLDDSTKKLLQRTASPNEILNDVPAEALFVYNANNLKENWEQTKQNLEANPDFAETFGDMQQEMGFDLDQDIFSWMTGEFTLVFLEASPPDEFSPPLGGYMLIGTDDVAGAQAHLNNVTSAMEEQQMLPPLETKTVGGVELQAMTDFDGKVVGGYGFYKNYFLLGYLEEAIIAATSAAQNSLKNNNNFKAVQSQLPANNFGYVYANVDPIRRMAEEQMSDFDREDYNKYIRPFIEPIHAVGAAGSTDGFDQGISTGTFFVLITE